MANTPNNFNRAQVSSSFIFLNCFGPQLKLKSLNQKLEKFVNIKKIHNSVSMQVKKHFTVFFFLCIIMSKSGSFRFPDLLH